MVERIRSAEGSVRIALVGKYVQLQDAYLSVVEALNHAAIHHGTRLEVVWVDAETLSVEEAERRLAQADGILIPGGFGIRGIEGKIAAARFARENGVPFLGICLGMQVAVVEFARHVVGLDGANSSEFDPATPYPVIDLLPEQKGVSDMGGTMRLGSDPVTLVEGSLALAAYGERVVHERHRHRYEVNNSLRPRLVAKGLARLGHVARRAAGRDHRAARPSVVLREPVPPRVQVAAQPAAAALPRLRRRGGRSAAGGAAARPSPRSRPRTSRRDRRRLLAGARGAHARAGRPVAHVRAALVGPADDDAAARGRGPRARHGDARGDQPRAARGPAPGRAARRGGRRRPRPAAGGDGARCCGASATSRVRLPDEFVRRLALAASRGQAVWQAARRDNDWASFRPCVEEMVELKREQADLLGHDGERYDALLDLYEPGMTHRAGRAGLLGAARPSSRADRTRSRRAARCRRPPFAGAPFPPTRSSGT